MIYINLKETSFASDDSLVLINDCQIVDLKLVHNEGEAACAMVQVIRPDKDKPHIRIHDGFNVIFVGRLVGVPSLMRDGIYESHYLGIDERFADKYRTFCETLTQMHPLLWDLDGERMNALEIHSALPKIDCVTHDITLCPILGEGDVTDITSDVLENTVSIGMVAEPIQAVDVTVSVSFIQEQRGHFNLFPIIENAFQAKRVNTFQAGTFQKFFPVAGQSLSKDRFGKSGYTVLQSILNEDEKTERLKRSAKYTIGSVEKPETIQFKRTWFKGELWVGWTYITPRIQTLRFSIHPHFMAGKGRRKVLDFHLQHPITDKAGVLCDHDMRRVLSDIQRIATAHYHMGNRVRRLQCQVIGKSLLLTPGQRVRLNDFVGVVAGLERHVNYEGDIAVITVMDSVSKDDVVTYDFDNVSIPMPDDENAHLKQLPAGAFVERCEIFNAPEMHERIWSAKQHEEGLTIASLRACVRQQPTTISIQFKNLYQKEPLVQKICLHG